jgi:hypothetical protein
MFEQSKLLGELAKLQIAAGTSKQQEANLIYVAKKTGVLKDAVEFSKGGVGPKLGAARLILGLCESTAGTDCPSSLIEALKRLFEEAVISIESLLNEPSRNYVPARILHASAMGIQLEIQSTSEIEPKVTKRPVVQPIHSVERSRGAVAQVNEMPPNPAMPDITRSKVVRMWDTESHQIILVKNAKMIAYQTGKGPINYPLTLAVIKKGQSGPAFFVTLEKSIYGTACLCVFEGDGTHLNLGSREEWKDENIFVRKGLEIIKREFGLTSKLQEMVRR